MGQRRVLPYPVDQWFGRDLVSRDDEAGEPFGPDDPVQQKLFERLGVQAFLGIDPGHRPAGRRRDGHGIRVPGLARTQEARAEAAEDECVSGSWRFPRAR